jgi:hypothetical protein
MNNYAIYVIYSYGPSGFVQTTCSLRKYYVARKYYVGRYYTTLDVIRNTNKSKSSYTRMQMV